MIADYYQYIQIKGSKRSSEMRDALPSHLIQDLMCGGVFDSLIAVEVSKTDVVRHLDEYMQVESDAPSWTRVRKLEVDESEIDNYEYFWVGFKACPQSKWIHFEFTRPTCSVENCYCGAAITLPLRLDDRWGMKRSLCEVEVPWNAKALWLLSSDLADRFKQISGLSFSEPLGANKDIHVAEITGRFEIESDQITVKDGVVCHEHHYISNYKLLGKQRILRPLADVNINDALRVGDVVYRPRRFGTFVSRKVLLELLASCCSSLQGMGARFNKPYLPFPIADDGTILANSF